MTKINTAIIGAGYWGKNLIRNFYNTETCNLQIVCDTSIQAIEYLKKHYPTINTTYEDYSKIISNETIKAVVIATPASEHYKMAKTSLTAGKHTFVEKPLAMRSIECEELIRIAKEKKVVLMAGHTFLYNAAVRKVKEYIEEKILGDIYYIYAQRLNLGIVRQDVNVMWNLAPHDISIILYWLNKKPLQVTAKGLTYLQNGIPDVVFLTLDFEDNISAHIHLSWLDPGKIRRSTVVGSEKMVVYDDTSQDMKIQIYDKGITRKNITDSLGDFDDFGKFQLIHRAGDLLVPKIEFREPISVECHHFMDCILNNKTPLTDGKNGLLVVKILEAAQESLDKNGIPINIDLNVETV